MKNLTKAMGVLLAGSMLFSGAWAQAKNETASVAADEDKQIQAVSAQWENDLNELKQYKIFEGDTNGDFMPYENITRAEMAKAVCKVLGLKPDNNSEQIFSDVSSSHWAYGYINVLVSAGVINGDSETFSPDSEALCGEILKMFVCALGYEQMAEQTGGYPYGYLRTAKRIGLTKNLDYSSEDSCERCNAFALFKNALDIPLMVQTGFDFGGDGATYAIADGNNGMELRTFRQMITEIKD